MDVPIAKTLPHNREAELAVLGAAILEPSSFLTVLPILKPYDFFLSEHQVIYGAMQALFAADRPINTVELMEILNQGGRLEAAGGLAYLSQLADGLPRVTDSQHFARIVRSKARQRELIHFGEHIQRRAWDGEDDLSIVDGGIAALLKIASDQQSLSGPRSWRDVAKSAVDELVSAKLDPSKAGRMKSAFRR